MVAEEGKVLLDGTDSSSSDAGSFVSTEDATDASSNVGNAIQYIIIQSSRPLPARRLSPIHTRKSPIVINFAKEL